MEEQGEMFEVENHDGRPNWRKTDPVTSKMAGREVEQTGVAGKQRKIFLDLVRAHPGKTSRELADIAGEDRYAGSRRLPELERDNLVRKGAPRKCAVGGKMSVVWLPV